MSTDPRHYAPGPVVLVKTYTNLGNPYLAPSAEINDLVGGAVGYGLRELGLPFHGLHVAPDVVGLLVHPDDAEQVARFMNLAVPAISRELGRIRGERGHYFCRGHELELVSHEPEAQLDVLCQLLAMGAGTGPDADPRTWAGLNSTAAILDGAVMTGVRWNRTRMHDSTPRQVELDPERFCERIPIVHSPLPALAHLEEKEYRKVVADALAAHLAQRQAEGETGARPPPREPEAGDEVRQQRRRRSRLRIHAATAVVREIMTKRYAAGLAQFRRAGADQRAGRTAVFPSWCFPPAPPFVRSERLAVIQSRLRC